MAVYLVTPTNPKVPAVRLAADDLIDLGNQVAAYMARHKQLHRSLPYAAEIGDDYGALHQHGAIPKPVTFHIAQES